MVFHYGFILCYGYGIAEDFYHMYFFTFSIFIQILIAACQASHTHTPLRF